MLQPNTHTETPSMAIESEHEPLNYDDESVLNEVETDRFIDEKTARIIASKAVPPVVEWGPTDGSARREERESYGPSL